MEFLERASFCSQCVSSRRPSKDRTIEHLEDFDVGASLRRELGAISSVQLIQRGDSHEYVPKGADKPEVECPAKSLLQTRCDPTDTRSVAEVVARVIGCDVSLMTVSRVSSGAASVLFRVQPVQYEEDKTVLVRVFVTDDAAGQDETFVANILPVARPYTLGRFLNGCVDSWPAFFRKVSINDIADVATSIRFAVLLAKLHSAVKPDGGRERLDESVALWSTLRQWLKEASKGGMEALLREASSRGVATLELALGMSLVDYTLIEDAINELEENLALQVEPPVPAYCDMLASNLMLDEERGQLLLVDFGCKGMGYAAFDIATHFLEWCGGAEQAPDISRYPSERQQRVFVETYLETFRGVVDEAFVDSLLLQVLLIITIHLSSDRLRRPASLFTSAHQPAIGHTDPLSHSHLHPSRYPPSKTRAHPQHPHPHSHLHPSQSLGSVQPSRIGICNQSIVQAPCLAL